MDDKPISSLAAELMQREIDKNPAQFKVERRVDRSEPGMSPHLLATLGGLVDAASTYTFMKRGTHQEGNPLVNIIARQHPEGTGLAALGGLLATKGATKLIGKKWPKVADIIAANLGAEQLGVGIHNFAKTFGADHNRQEKYSTQEWHDVLGRNRIVDSMKDQTK